MSEDKDTTPSFTLTQPLISREEDRKAKEKARRATPEYKAKRLAYASAYYEANKAKRLAYASAYYATPEQKAKKKAIKATSEHKAKQTAYEATPERKAQRKARYATPEWKAYEKARRATPERKAYEKARREPYRLKYKYRMTVQQFDSMIEAQGNRCLCCKTLFGLLKAHKPFVDHSHKTGAVRGILCHECNVTLGHARDNPKILRALARYLERNQTE